MSKGGKKIPVTVTFLEMTNPPALPRLPQPKFKLALMRAEKPPVHFYRYLYDVVGREWRWVDRKRLSDEALAKIIHDDRIEIIVQYANGVPAGFAELDFRQLPTVADLSYFGLIPEFIGHGLGPWLLRWAIEEMWDRGPKRVTVNTCTLDHPSALPLYQRMGFRPYDRRQAYMPVDT